MDTGRREFLASHLPRFFVRRRPDPEDTLPFRQQFPASLLFVDVAGFTRLTLRLSERGPVGAEQLSGFLDRIFGRITGVILDHGGDVLAYAGDAVLAFWPEPSANRPTEGLNAAARAAFAIQGILADAAASDMPIRLRATLGAGTVSWLEVGGVGDYWPFLVVGEVFNEVAIADAGGASGTVVVTRESWPLLAATWRGEPLPSGGVRLIGLPPGEPGQLSDSLPSGPGPGIDRYVPPFVRDCGEAGRDSWVPEFRHISALFVNLRGGVDWDEPLSLHPAIRLLQETLARFEGCFYQVLSDDKGLSVVAAFGLPSYTHEDDAVRAVLAAQEMTANLASLGIDASCGVATGLTFYGLCGLESRQQFTMVGPVMNAAARLMQAADHGVLCDTETARAAEHPRLRFHAQEAIRAKGIDDPIPVNRPQVVELAHRTRATTARPDLVGRSTERGALLDVLDRASGGACARAVVEGEPGIGKSALLDFAVAEAQARGFSVFRGAGDAIEKHTPYFAWRTMIAGLFGLDPTAPIGDQRRAVLGRLEKSPNLALLGALANRFLPFEIPETDATRQMDEESRADASHRLILRLIQDAAAGSPILIAFEDGHWLDAASWTLLSQAWFRLTPMAAILTTRRVAEPGPGIRDVLAEPELKHLQLCPLESGGVTEMVCRRLGVDQLPPVVSRVIAARSGGNPFFAEALTLGLLDAGLIEVHEGRCRLGDGAETPSLSFDEAVEAAGFPGSIRGVLAARLDRLPSAPRLTLKVASVFGQRVPVEALQALHPVSVDRRSLEENLGILDQRGLIRMDVPAGAFEFGHALTRDVAYESMAFAQRRPLHLATAQWIEKRHVDALSPHYAALSHHWRHAQDPQRAMDYANRAGHLALKHFANTEAVRHLRVALELDDELNADPDWQGIDPARRAIWEFHLGKAYVNGSGYGEGRPFLERGLAELDRAPPGGTLPRMRGLFADVMRQVLHRVRPGSCLGRRQMDAGRLLESSRALEALTEIHYMGDDMLPCLHSAIRSLNLAELAGPSEELARGYASVGAILGFMRLRGAARSYADRALAVAREVDSPRAEAYVSLATAVYLAGIGEWEEASSLLGNAADIAASMGNHRRRQDAVLQLAAISFYRGDFHGTLELASQLHDSASETRHLRYLGVAARRQAYCHFALGQLEPVEGCIRTLEQGSGFEGGFEHLDLYVIRAMHRLRSGDQEGAVESATAASRILEATSPALFDILHDYTTLGEVWLGLDEASWRASGQAGLSRVLRSLKSYGLMFPIGRPATLRLRGELALRHGKAGRARRTWRKALAAAEDLGMPFEKALLTTLLTRNEEVQ